MFIAHLPAGYLLTHGIARKHDTIRRRALTVGLIFSVLPDLDLLYFYFADGRRTPHHDYLTHSPIFWLGVAALTAATLILAGRRRYIFFVWVALANVMMHLFLDSIAADIRWFHPFAETRFNLVEVPARFEPWYLNFILHWTFAAEIAICAAALWVWRLQRRRNRDRRVEGNAAVGTERIHA
ncbi:metal-dependent hydrolase [Mesorhizobium plurifarium]|uniref:metal-dependent hydrolase n=1 Tax=Sinorhizobium arboris TaxID=76745 RepID=UPI00042544A1|nr:metal-dependent hydrolase [Sinorhizobium arboris]PST22026.1 metal-dependent hydrolase [Mesorhizobium plurifarium]